MSVGAELVLGNDSPVFGASVVTIARMIENGGIRMRPVSNKKRRELWKVFS